MGTPITEPLWGWAAPWSNDGTIVLVAQGSGTKSGGAGDRHDGSIRNNGSIVAEVQDPSWTVQYQAGLTNTRAGMLTVTGGTFNDDGGSPVTNDGTVKIGPGALYLLQEASVFTNNTDGRIVAADREHEELRAVPAEQSVLWRRGGVHRWWQPSSCVSGRTRAGGQHRVPTVPALGRELQGHLRPARQGLHG